VHSSLHLEPVLSDALRRARVEGAIMGNDWSSSCSLQLHRDAALQNSILLGVGSFTVLLYACSTIVSALHWHRWRLRKSAVTAGARYWRLYGPFIALLCVGSACGCVGWSARIKQRHLQYSVKNDAAISNALVYAVSNQWAAVFCVFYSLSFLCTSAGTLMVHPPPPLHPHSVCHAAVTRRTSQTCRFWTA